jgi:hypothetical protein
MPATLSLLSGAGATGEATCPLAALEGAADLPGLRREGLVVFSAMGGARSAEQRNCCSHHPRPRSSRQRCRSHRQTGPFGAEQHRPSAGLAPVSRLLFDDQQELRALLQTWSAPVNSMSSVARWGSGVSDFKGRHFRGDVIMWAVRWYCRYGASYRDLEAMLGERGVAVDHSTIYRWVQRHAPEMETRLRWYRKRPLIARNWRVDETCRRAPSARPCRSSAAQQGASSSCGGHEESPSAAARLAAAAMGRGHVGGGPGLVDEHEALGIGRSVTGRTIDTDADSWRFGVPRGGFPMPSAPVPARCAGQYLSPGSIPALRTGQVRDASRSRALRRTRPESR